MLLDPAAPGLIPSIPEFFSEEKIVEVAEVNQWCCLKESGQRLENVDQTHPILASNKQVPQKNGEFLLCVRKPVMVAR